jgi:hypothetical protein
MAQRIQQKSAVLPPGKADRDFIALPYHRKVRDRASYLSRYFFSKDVYLFTAQKIPSTGGASPYFTSRRLNFQLRAQTLSQRAMVIFVVMRKRTMYLYKAVISTSFTSADSPLAERFWDIRSYEGISNNKLIRRADFYHCPPFLVISD